MNKLFVLLFVLSCILVAANAQDLRNNFPNQETRLAHKGIVLTEKTLDTLDVNIERLNLNGNFGLPKNIVRFKQLKVLEIGHNDFSTGLTEAIGELKELKSLYLVNSKLKMIPKEIKNLKNLQELNLSYNSLETLPLEIGELENLQKLGIIENPIKMLPQTLFELKKLKSLNLNGTLLSNRDVKKFKKMAIFPIEYDRQRYSKYGGK